MAVVQVSKMQSTAEEESRLAELVTVDTRRSTLGSVLQSVVNYGRPSLSLPGRDKEQRVDTAEKRLSLGSPVANLRSPAAFGRSLCCMFFPLTDTCTMYMYMYITL